VNIYFKENHFTASHRSELYGTAKFLAKCGGILGLCLGVSVLSCFEIVYFSTFRLWFNLKRGEAPDSSGSWSSPFALRKVGHNGILKLTKGLLADYSRKTTIQGIKYVADSNLSMVERLWWTFIVVVSALCCGSLISDAMRHYEQSPVIISYANDETLVSQVIS